MIAVFRVHQDDPSRVVVLRVLVLVLRNGFVEEVRLTSVVGLEVMVILPTV